MVSGVMIDGPEKTPSDLEFEAAKKAQLVRVKHGEVIIPERPHSSSCLYLYREPYGDR